MKNGLNKSPDMHRYFFILGKNPSLSLSEINSWLKKLRIQYTLDAFSQEILLVSTEVSLKETEVIKTLGGTVKFGKILDETYLKEEEQDFNKILSADNLLEKYFSNKKQKLHFGVSVYNCGGDKRLSRKLVSKVKELCLLIKKNLKDSNIKAGFLLIKGDKLSSVSVVKNKLLRSNGAEIVLITTPTSMLVGKTLSVQEFADFSFRDYGRPQRDKKSGIIPPKLARMMINLSQKDKESVFLDPFCGSGTIIQEAIMLGFRNIIASDISEKAVLSAKKNIDWLFDNFPRINKLSYNINWWVSDVRLLNNKLVNNSIDVIVTEPYLGPPLLKKPDILFIQKILTELGSLYLEAFKIFKGILRPNGKITIVFPVFAENGRLHFIEIIDKILKLGFEKEEFVPFMLSQRGTILYGTSDHFIIREVLVFRKKGDDKL